MANDGDLYGSMLGEYYITISLGDYSRPQPFAKSTFSPHTIIKLPLPSELRDDSTIGWSNENLDTVGDFINPGSAGAKAAAAGLRKSGDLVSGLAGKATRALGDAATSNFGAAGSLASSALGAATDMFPAEKIASAFQQAMGMAPNPNPSVMFTGPILREFSYSWTLLPKNEKESRNIMQIVKKLKMAALPANQVSGSAAVLKYPNIAQINFYPWDGMPGIKTEWGWGNKSIIKIKKCVMSSVNANYTPANAPAFFEGTKAPVATQLSIAFKEIEYMLAGDYGGSTGGDIGTIGTAFGKLFSDWGGSQEPPAAPSDNAVATT